MEKMMGMFGKMFGSQQRPYTESVRILLATLPKARMCSMFRIVELIEKQAESKCLSEGGRNMENNFSNCDELLTSLQMYEVVKTLSKYITSNEQKNEILSLIAFQDQQHDGNKIFNKFVQIFENRGNIENSSFAGEYRAKIFYDILTLLTEGTPIANNSKLARHDQGYNFIRLVPSLELSFLFEFRNLDTAHIIHLAFDKEFAMLPFNFVISEIEKILLRKT